MNTKYTKMRENSIIIFHCVFMEKKPNYDFADIK